MSTGELSILRNCNGTYTVSDNGIVIADNLTKEELLKFLKEREY